MKELVHFENARTVTLVSGKKKAVAPLIDDSIEKHLFNNDVVMAVLDTASTPERSLSKIGEFCQHFIMSFGRLKDAVEFLETHSGDLRC